ncbi:MULTISPECIES: hypothetical protein [Mycobacterium]|jgi:hypothetical protein|nr:MULTISPECIES: hypothetical protein [Mycobacterium]MBI2703621.1 hypothetical protein [Mycobacterium sp.]MBX9979051.1 hypothetical protein [Mycobacterium gordonae]MCQ4361776.1 hypothetical protein [Mycobacterium gordonae]MCV7009257.1 hypothetical protein [Mycobacterium gordonae]
MSKDGKRLRQFQSQLLEETLPMAHEILFCEAEAVYSAPAFHAENVVD